MKWINAGEIGPLSFTCGHCTRVVGPSIGYYPDGRSGEGLQPRIYICSYCQRPSYFLLHDEGKILLQSPGVPYGADVEHLPEDIDALYNEARRCIAARAPTAAVMAARKILMNVAVQKGARANLTFLEYVTWLVDNHYVPAGSDTWVDHIRKKGNDATHEINLMNVDDAKEVISFVEMLLKLIYEFPARVAPSSSAPEGADS